MITVDVCLYASLGRYTSNLEVGRPQSVAVATGTTAGELLGRLGVPLDVVQLVFVSGRSRPLDHVLADGDRVGIFPPIGGG